MSLLFVLYFVIPGAVLARRCFGEKPGRWEVLAAIGLAVLAVGWAGYVVALLTFFPYWHHTFIFINLWYLYKNRSDWREIADSVLQAVRRGLPYRESLIAGIFIFAGVLSALVLYQEETFSFSCLYRSLGIATNLGVGDARMESTILLLANEGEREGAFAVMAPFAVLWQHLGLRLFFAFSVGLSAVFGYLASRLVLESMAGRLLATFLFLAFPFGADILWNDINTVTLFAVSASVFAFLHPTIGTRHKALFYGIFIAIRHTGLLTLPAALLLLGRGGKPKKTEVIQFLKTFGWVSLPWYFHHLISFGPFGFESFLEYHAHPHSFLGIPFTLHGMLNFPFFPEVVRTPFNPLPTFLLFPVWFFSRMGLVLAGVFLVGVGLYLASQAPRKKAVLLWCGPYMLLLGVNENWLQTEKFGILAPVLPWVFLGTGFGLERLLRWKQYWKPALALSGAMAGIFLFSRGAFLLDFPLDIRFYKEFPWFLQEKSTYLKAERNFLEVHPWPSAEWVQMTPEEGRWYRFFNAFLAPSFEERFYSSREEMIRRNLPQAFKLALEQREMAPVPPPSPCSLEQTWKVSLEYPWLDGGEWLQKMDSEPPEGSLTFNLCDDSSPIGYEKFPLPWAPDYAATVNAFRSHAVAYLVLSGPNTFEQTSEGPSLVFLPRTALENPPPEGLSVYLTVPAHEAFRVVESVSTDPSRIYIWQVPAGKTVADLQGPIHWRHN